MLSEPREQVVLGRFSVDIEAFTAYQTYEGWVEGYPNPGLNAEIIEIAKERARTLTPFESTPVHVIRPSCSRAGSTPSGGPADYEPFPDYCCIARFVHDGRELLVIWFCDRLPLHGSSVSRQVSQVPWDKLAVPHDWDDDLF